MKNRNFPWRLLIAGGWAVVLAVLVGPSFAAPMKRTPSTRAPRLQSPAVARDAALPASRVPMDMSAPEASASMLSADEDIQNGPELPPAAEPAGTRDSDEKAKRRADKDFDKAAAGDDDDAIVPVDPTRTSYSDSLTNAFINEVDKTFAYGELITSGAFEEIARALDINASRKQAAINTMIEARRLVALPSGSYLYTDAGRRKQGEQNGHLMAAHTLVDLAVKRLNAGSLWEVSRALENLQKATQLYAESPLKKDEGLMPDVEALYKNAALIFLRKAIQIHDEKLAGKMLGASNPKRVAVRVADEALAAMEFGLGRELSINRHAEAWLSFFLNNHVTGLIAEEGKDGATYGAVTIAKAFLESVPPADSEAPAEKPAEKPAKKRASAKKSAQAPAATPPARSAEDYPVPDDGEISGLMEYAVNLTKLAIGGKLDPVIGRENEMRRAAQALVRKRKKNGAIVGDRGVGKTVFVEGLAQYLASPAGPEALWGRNIVLLDVAKMVAGTENRGMFEERFKKAMDDVLKINKRAMQRPEAGLPTITIFVDEMHALASAGDAKGATTAAEMLKPYLADGVVSVLGATTRNEYRNSIERDPALKRRFTLIDLAAPSPEEAARILKGLRPAYEKEHGVTYTDEVIEAAVSLAVRFFPDKTLPDSAIDLIDEAGAARRIALGRRGDAAARVISVADLEKEVSSQRGIPLGTVSADERALLSTLGERIRGRVIGQDKAVERTVVAVQNGRLGLGDEKRPIAGLVFLGKTGVGKTELSRALGEALFGSEGAALRLDMSEYMDEHSVKRLIGVQPGYVNSDQPGTLTEPVRTNPYRVLVFDEIEKAHPKVFDLLLQIMEEGVLTDAWNNKIYFKHSIIILTTNAGTAELQELRHSLARRVGFKAAPGAEPALAPEEMESELIAAFRSSVRPELAGRFGEHGIVVFNDLGAAQMPSILGLRVRDFVSRMARQKIALTVTPAAQAWILASVPEAELRAYGARPIRDAVDRTLADVMRPLLLAGGAKPGDAVVIDYTPAAQGLTGRKK